MYFRFVWELVSNFQPTTEELKVKLLFCRICLLLDFRKPLAALFTSFSRRKKRALLCQKGKSLRKEEVMRKKPKKDFHLLFTLFSARKCVKWDWNLWKYFPSDKKLPRGIKRRENVSSVLVAFRKMRRSWELLFEYYGSRKEIQLM